MRLNLKLDKSSVTACLFLSVLILLPFSRLSELPILALMILGIWGMWTNRGQLQANQQFVLLSHIFISYFLLIMISALDSYWQEKTFIVGIASVRFYCAAIAVLLYVSPKHFKFILNGITIVALLWSIDALFQYFNGVNIIGRASYDGRLNGMFGEHHAKLGPVLALLLPVLMVSVQQKSQFIRWLLPVLLIITVILSGTRSAWLMMLFVLLAYWFYHVKHRRLFLLIKASALAAFMIIGLWLISPDFQKRMDRSLAAFSGSQSGLDFALANRLSIWQTSLNMIKQHPINGVGAHAFRKAYPLFADKDDKWQKQGGVGMHAHHWVLEILAETGLMGALLMTYAILKLGFFIHNNYNGLFTWAFGVMLISAFLPIISTYSLFASFWSLCLWFCGTGLVIMSHKQGGNYAKG